MLDWMCKCLALVALLCGSACSSVVRGNSNARGAEQSVLRWLLVGEGLPGCDFPAANRKLIDEAELVFVVAEASALEDLADARVVRCYDSNAMRLIRWSLDPHDNAYVWVRSTSISDKWVYVRLDYVVGAFDEHYHIVLRQESADWFARVVAFDLEQ